MTGRPLPPSSPFAGDDGRADPALRSGLERYAAGGVGAAEVVALLAGARVLVPVLAQEEAGAAGGEAGADAGVAEDGGPSAGAPGRAEHPGGCDPGGAGRHASTGVVAVSAPDGRTALPVFTSTASLAAWHGGARPMPAEAPRAAAAAIQEGWELLVVDPAGPVPFVVPRPAVRALASGTTWQPAVVGGEVRPGLRDVVVAALDGIDALRGPDAVPGTAAEVAVVLPVVPGLDRQELDAVLGEVARRLAASAAVAAEVDSLEMRVVSAGVGAANEPAPRRRWLRRPGPRGSRG